MKDTLGSWSFGGRLSAYVAIAATCVRNLLIVWTVVVVESGCVELCMCDVCCQAPSSKHALTVF